jgi:hypothetical protein
MAHPAITLSGIAGHDPVSFLLLMCGRVWPFFFASSFLAEFSRHLLGFSDVVRSVRLRHC